MFAWRATLGLVDPTTPGAKALESRLYAPCCYGGTLDTHDSDLAKSLRDEIETRLSHGETTETIQSDFVTRYGEKVLAARSDAPIRQMGVSLIIGMAIAAVALLVLVRRWTRRSTITATSPRAPRDALDDRIDAELNEIE